MKEAIGRLLSGALTAVLSGLRCTTTALLVDQAAPRPFPPTMQKDVPATVVAVIKIELILGR